MRMMAMMDEIGSGGVIVPTKIFHCQGAKNEA